MSKSMMREGKVSSAARPLSPALRIFLVLIVCSLIVCCVRLNSGVSTDTGDVKGNQAHIAADETSSIEQKDQTRLARPSPAQLNQAKPFLEEPNWEQF